MLGAHSFTADRLMIAIIKLRETEESERKGGRKGEQERHMSK